VAWVAKNFQAAPKDPDITSGPDAGRNARLEMFAYAFDIAEKRLADPRDDLISALVHADVNDERLTVMTSSNSSCCL
jgi:cytochrome P450